MNDPQNSVVVTGLGLICSLGLNLQEAWSQLIISANTIRRFSLFETGDLIFPYGFELPAGADDLFKQQIMTRNRRQMTRATMIALCAAEQAVIDSGLDLSSGLVTAGAVVGATGTGYVSDYTTDPDRILKNMASASGAWLGLKYKLNGPSFVVSTACSSGTYAMNSACDLILSGQCQAVITGSAESSLSYPDVKGFESLLATSQLASEYKTASRPFEKTRDGFVMGEGGGMLVLESWQHARKRGAHIYATVHRPALTTESYNIISPRPGGEGMAKTMELALKNASLHPEDIGYINTHGTGTKLNDLCEVQAIQKVFSDCAGRIPISSAKSMTGHCLSGASGIEAVLSCMALEKELLPQTLHFDKANSDFDLDIIGKTPRKKRVNHIMSNTFAFGGHNGVSIFSRPG
ncbi:MAG: hypothetical protein A2096_17800 [Spirochaetes bacterium GWF1_41_5]|nr:MAG: hypothetical protein A2096_17800 [Spirochaetes bacterium GWF1_41_5]